MEKASTTMPASKPASTKPASQPVASPVASPGLTEAEVKVLNETVLPSYDVIIKKEKYSYHFSFPQAAPKGEVYDAAWAVLFAVSLMIKNIAAAVKPKDAGDTSVTDTSVTLKGDVNKGSVEDTNGKETVDVAGTS